MPSATIEYESAQVAKARRQVRTLRIAKAMVAILLTAMLIASLIPTIGRGPGPLHGNWGKCLSNLHQFGQGIALYCNDYKGHYPPTFDVLFTAEDLSPEVALCPSTNTTRPATQPSPAWFNASGDYIYLGAGLTSSAPPDIVVAHDRTTGNHHPAALNVLFSDGTSREVTLKDWPATLAQSAKSRAAWAATSRPNPGARGAP